VLGEVLSELSHPLLPDLSPCVHINRTLIKLTLLKATGAGNYDHCV